MPWNRFFVLQEIDAQIGHLHEELDLASLLLNERTAHLDAESAQARRQVETIEDSLKQRVAQRAEAAGALPQPFLARYERLRSKWKTGPWVLTLASAACPACNLVLPSKLLGDAQRVGEPIACPNCARLLIWRSSPGAASGSHG